VLDEARTHRESRCVLKNGSKADLNAVKPGEVLLLADGDYGAAVFNRDGEPGRPIVYRSTSGKAVFSEISLTNRKWVYLEGVTVNGPVRLNGSEHCVVRRCTINAQFGIKAYKPGMMNCCIEDNVITGIREWKPEIMGAGGDNEGEGIQFTGSGNVIRHNRVSGFRDCISHMEDDGAVEQSATTSSTTTSDSGLDDGIEADFALHNCRVMRNRLTNCFVGISSQPGLGGPNYFLRNVMFNIILEPFKLHRSARAMSSCITPSSKPAMASASTPASLLIMPASSTHNLFIGGKPPAKNDLRRLPHQPDGRAWMCRASAITASSTTMPTPCSACPLKAKSAPGPSKRFPAPTSKNMAACSKCPFHLPEDPARLYEPPDLSALTEAGAYAGEKVPVYGPRR
jgi:hypothetical protein